MHIPRSLQLLGVERPTRNNTREEGMDSGEVLNFEFLMRLGKIDIFSSTFLGLLCTFNVHSTMPGI